MAGIRWLLTFLLIGSVGGARAQAPDSSEAGAEAAGAPPGYREAADLAVEEFSRGNYLEARARFEKAHEIWPNARSLRALGYCEYELKNYVAALRRLRAALASQVRPLAGSLRQETEQLEALTRGYVARYVIQTVPSDARLSLDGLELVLDAQRAVQMSIGEHTLEGSATGYQSVRRVLHAEGGSDRTLSIELPREVEASTLPSEDKHDEQQPLRTTWWLWTGVGAVVVAGVTAGLIAALQDPGTRDASGGNTGVSLQVAPP
jgi:hypothetical protein